MMNLFVIKFYNNYVIHIQHSQKLSYIKYIDIIRALQG